MSICSTAAPDPKGAPVRRVLGEQWDGRDTFTVEEAGCQILRLSRCAAYAAAESGALPTVRIGRRLLVPRVALERMLAGE
jgi:excisionase family DNA binding protein